MCTQRSRQRDASSPRPCSRSGSPRSWARAALSWPHSAGGMYTMAACRSPAMCSSAGTRRSARWPDEDQPSLDAVMLEVIERIEVPRSPYMFSTNEDRRTQIGSVGGRSSRSRGRCCDVVPPRPAALDGNDGSAGGHDVRDCCGSPRPRGPGDDVAGLRATSRGRRRPPRPTTACVARSSRVGQATTCAGSRWCGASLGISGTTTRCTRSQLTDSAPSQSPASPAGTRRRP